MKLSFKHIAYFFILSFFLLGSSVHAVFADTAQAIVPSTTSSNISENWAGYVSQGNTYTSVSGSWNVPVPTVNTNTPTATDATWVGIGGVTTSDLIQSGTEAVVQNGSVTYEAWVETLPNAQTIIPLTVHGGDSVSVSLNETSTNEWALLFTDTTTGQDYQQLISYDSSNSSAEWIEEMPAGVSGRGTTLLPLDNFGQVQFQNGKTTMNGTQTTLSGSNAQSLTLINQNNQALAVPSPIGADGASFSVSRTNVASGSVGSSTQNPSQRNNFHRTGVGIRGFTSRSRTMNGLFGSRTVFIVPSFRVFREENLQRRG